MRICDCSSDVFSSVLIWPLALIARLFAPGARIVLSAHGTDVSYSARGGVRGRLYGLYQLSGARLLHSASVITNSHATANASRSHGWNKTGRATWRERGCQNV